MTFFHPFINLKLTTDHFYIYVNIVYVHLHHPGCISLGWLILRTDYKIRASPEALQKYSFKLAVLWLHGCSHAINIQTHDAFYFSQRAERIVPMTFVQ